FDFAGRYSRDGATPRRRVIATPAARRLASRRRTPLGLGAARLGQSLRARFDRPVRIIEAEPAVARFVGDDDDADMTAAFEPAEQDLFGEALLDMSLDT